MLFCDDFTPKDSHKNTSFTAVYIVVNNIKHYQSRRMDQILALMAPKNHKRIRDLFWRLKMDLLILKTGFDTEIEGEIYRITAKIDFFCGDNQGTKK